MDKINYTVSKDGDSNTKCNRNPSFKASSQSFNIDNVYVGSWACNHCDKKIHHDYKNKIITCLNK